VAIQGLLDELGEVGVLARQIINPSRGHNLAGAKDSVDNE
jgi:hypothetical protein